MSRDAFVPGQWNFICDRCGRAFKSGEGRKTWDNLYTCKRCWEPRHPQDYVKGREERPVPPWVRPRRDTTVHAGPRRVPALFTAPAAPRYLNFHGYGGSPNADQTPLPLTPLNPFLYLLLHGNGTDGNNLVDMSPNAHTPTAGSGLIISASVDAWGGSAIEVNGSLGAPDYREYTLPFADAGQAFTLEYFLQIKSSGGDGDGFTVGRQEVLRLVYSDGSYAHTANCAIHSSTTHTLTVPAAQSCEHALFDIAGGRTQRVHVVYQRQTGAGTQCFLNGRYVAESGLTTDAMIGLRIGDPGTTSRNANVWIDGLRFLKGQALYPARTIEAHGDLMFTPPTTPFEPNEL